MSTEINHYKVNNWNGKPYNFFGDYLWKKFNCRVLKLPINAHLGCPNRDGTVSTKGCIFCSEEGSASPTTSGIQDIQQQMKNARESFIRSDTLTKYIAYFQAYTNTYASPDILKNLFDTALSGDDIVGLMIGTRPDCLPDEILSLLHSYQRDNFEFWLEIGMQSIHDTSLHLLNRGHTYHQTRDAVMRAADYGLNMCLHVILGIPGENWDMMMETAHEISKLPVQGVKLHHLHVIKNTILEEMYNTSEFEPIGFRTYISYLCDFIERLRQDILIHRLMGDRSEDTLIAPKWGLHKGTVLNAIDDEFKKRGSFQGLLL
ncbi:MAG TPA: TIGR01212 family radical SAM protein [Spirochaetota bacterium]|nr:TIGR01212 family radical SAM protein [Spirochaetota bacterium]HPJ37164.1 TIGR01212 family radical SAM protein [Spirochaetota bacterium]HPQ51705.1 TIGR01212 family radical SAM protein [Spirochaetota bacterium]